MRLILAAVLALTVGTTAHAQNQQQCEALAKPIEAKIAPFQNDDPEDEKATPQRCAQTKELIKLYEEYKVKADKLNCPFAYVEGKKLGGADMRVELLADIKQAYKEKCR